jgi:hypothetical protein
MKVLSLFLIRDITLPDLLHVRHLNVSEKENLGGFAHVSINSCVIGQPKRNFGYEPAIADKQSSMWTL